MQGELRMYVRICLHLKGQHGRAVGIGVPMLDAIAGSSIPGSVASFPIIARAYRVQEGKCSVAHRAYSGSSLS